MTKIKSDSCSELIKSYLIKLLDEANIDSILDSLVNNDEERIWYYVVGYKLLACQLEKLKITDPELAFLAGQFLGNYRTIELLRKKYNEKKEYSSKMDEIIAENEEAIDILSDLYVTRSLSTKNLLSKYDENVKKDIKLLKKEGIIIPIEKQKECCYMLEDKSRVYMKEHYFFNLDTEEEVTDKETDTFRSKALHLLREENRKGDCKYEKSSN